jgi:dTDP-4-amino-4,6-dideoxygalactose transaminase
MVSFLDLKKINSKYSKELVSAAENVINKGWYILGDQVELFESNLASYVGSNYAIGVGNGLDALKLILRGYIEMGILNIGDQILVPSNTFIATVLAITESGLNPIFIEPNPVTFNLDLDSIEKRISSKTKAIILVHLYGKTCWEKGFDALFKKYNLKVIEDNAQAIGSSFINDGIVKMTGSLGDAAAFSFYPGKNLGALGDGGAITTNDADLAKIVKALSNYGSQIKYKHNYIGINSRLDEIQAAFLNVKIKYLSIENDRRRYVANLYLDNIIHSEISLPRYTTDPREHVWHLFVVKTNFRDKLINHLNNFGIQTLIHYPIPIHRQTAYTRYHNLDLELTDAIHDQILSLPISPVLLESEIFEVIDAINQFEC